MEISFEKKLLAVLITGIVLVSAGYLSQKEQPVTNSAKDEFKVAELNPGA